MSTPQSPADAVPVHAASDRRLNPERRRPPVRFDGDGGVLVSIKGLIAVGALVGALITCWRPLQGVVAMADVPVTMKAISDTVNAMSPRLATVQRDMASTQNRVQQLESRAQAIDTWRAGIDQLKETRTRDMGNLEVRVRDLESTQLRSRR